MAKTPIGLGQFSGKVGGVVFAVYNGEQIVRQYQPKVLNPKSSRQQLQRAKGNLVGRISQIVPWQILQGMGSNRRERRANFLRVALNLASASPVQDNLRNISATLSNENFVFSQGAVIPTILVSGASAEARRVVVELSRMSGTTDEDFNASGALIVCVIKGVNGRYEYILYQFVSSDDFTQETYSITLSHVNEGSYVASVYLAPFSTMDGSSLRTKTEELTGNATGLNALLTSNPAAIPLNFGNSTFVANYDYTYSSRASEEREEESEGVKSKAKTNKK